MISSSSGLSSPSAAATVVLPPPAAFGSEISRASCAPKLWQSSWKRLFMIEASSVTYDSSSGSSTSFARSFITEEKARIWFTSRIFFESPRSAALPRLGRWSETTAPRASRASPAASRSCTARIPVFGSSLRAL